METIFYEAVNRSFGAGVLIIGILFLRMFLKRASKGMRYVLWLFVAIRLICPLPLESSFSLVPDVETITSQDYTDPARREREFAAPEGGTQGEGFAAPEGEFVPARNLRGPAGQEGPSADLGILRETASTIGWGRALPWVWVFGMAMMVFYGAVSYLRVKRRMRTAVRMEGNLWQSEQVVSPFIMGIIRPQIYLPFSLKEPEMTYVLAHERSHIRHGDHVIKPFGFVLLAVYWFQPLVWVAFVLLCRDMELACDERVVKSLGENERKEYAESLLALSVKRNKISVSPVAFGEAEVKGRIREILHYKKPGFWMMFLAVAVCLTAGVCFLTEPKKNVSESVPEEVLRKAEELAQADLYQYQTSDPEPEYDDWRIDHIEFAYEYEQLLGIDLVLYNYVCSLHVKHPEAVFLVGGTEIWDGEWVNFYGTEQLFFLRTSEGLRYFGRGQLYGFSPEDAEEQYVIGDVVEGLVGYPHPEEIIEDVPEIENLEELLYDWDAWIYDQEQVVERAFDYFNKQNLGDGIYAYKTEEGYPVEYYRFNGAGPHRACVQGTEEGTVIVVHMDRQKGYWRATGYNVRKFRV